MALTIDLTADLTGIGQRLGNILGPSTLYGGVTGGDVDGDGIDDFVALIPRGFGVILGGADVFDETLDGAAADITLGGATKRAFAVGDIDADGKADVVFATDDNGLGIAFGGTGPATFLPDIGTFRTAAVSDVNGDGFADILLTRYAATLIFGGSDRQSLTATDLTSFYSFGGRTGAGGDVNGDGYNDFIFDNGAPLGIRSYDRVATVFFGDPGLTLPIDPDALGDGGFTIAGHYSYSSYSEIVGDVNGDGFDDIVTARRDHPTEVDSFLIFGSATPTDLDTRALGDAGIRLAETGQSTFYPAIAAGDFNADGLADLLLRPVVGPASDRAYIVFGRDGGFDGDIDLTTLADDEGIAIALPTERSALVAGAVGDVNGDGFDDVAINDYSTSYLLFGFATTAGAQQVGDATAQALTGGDGADTLYGIDGGDTLDGGLGHDSLFGNSGDDSLDGGIGDDSLKSQIGDDTAAGGIGDDLIFGGGGNDSIDAGIGNDVANGNSGADTVAGGRGADTLRGQGGPDSLDGGIGNDMLLGMAGVDRLNGGDGNDTLIGGPADDVLTGGDGADIFVFAAGQGSDAIIDFADGIDRIALPGVAAFADLAIADTDLGARITLVAGGDGLTITLAGFAAAQLTAADFLFGS